MTIAKMVSTSSTLKRWQMVLQNIFQFEIRRRKLIACQYSLLKWMLVSNDYPFVCPLLRRSLLFENKKRITKQMIKNFGGISSNTKAYEVNNLPCYPYAMIPPQQSYIKFTACDEHERNAVNNSPLARVAG